TQNAAMTAQPTSARWHIIGLLVAYSFMSWFNRVSMSVAGNAKIIDGYGIEETQMGWIYTGLLLSYAICMTPGGWCIDRWGPWLALVVMGLGSAVFVALTGVVGLALTTAMAVWAGLMVVRVMMGIFTAPIYPASGRIIASWLPFSQRAFANGSMAA